MEAWAVTEIGQELWSGGGVGVRIGCLQELSFVWRGVMSTGNEENRMEAVPESSAPTAVAPVIARTEEPDFSQFPVDPEELSGAGFDAARKNWARLVRRRERRRSATLFVLTFASTLLVGAGFFPFEYFLASISPGYYTFLQQVVLRGADLEALLLSSVVAGLQYAGPVMLILVFHEMGHYLQAVRYRVPASLPYFIPLPLPPMGTMGAVIFQSPGAASRRQMFDIAVSGPLAGLVATLPVLWFGLQQSRYVALDPARSGGLEFGEPLVITWLIRLLHGPEPAGMVFELNQVAFAGWVGVFITSLNLLPIGQLDGGHILYTLIRRRAHVVAVLLYSAAAGAVLFLGNTSFVLLLVLLLLSGVRHPPTSDDSEPLGLGRHIVGWLTLCFLIIGFTPEPITVSSAAAPRSQPASVQSIEETPAEYPAIELPEMPDVPVKQQDEGGEQQLI